MVADVIASAGLVSAAVLAGAMAFLLALAACHRWGEGAAAEVRRARGAPSAWLRLARAAAGRLGDRCLRAGEGRFATWLRSRLTQAGEPADLQPQEIVGLQVVAGLGCVVAGGYACVAAGAPLWTIPAAGLAGAGYPLLWLRDRVKERRRRITRALPLALDLLTLSVEAGLDFPGALARVVENGRSGPLRDELALVLRQLRMGRTREEALQDLARRNRLPAVAAFVAALIQADRMGTSLGRVLRIQATQLRAERTQRAEKRAGEAPVRMLLPLIACIFPTVFLVLFGPIVFAMAVGGFGG